MLAVALLASPLRATYAAEVDAVAPVLAATLAASGTPGASGTTDASGTVDTSVTPSAPATHTVRTIGYSVQGRPIVVETFGVGPRHILLLAGIHGNEYGTPIAEAFLRYVRTHPSVVPSGTQFDVIAIANPDGRARNRRTNARNVDLNRNFPSRNWNRTKGTGGASPGSGPGSEPETKALVGLLASQRYARVISLHSKGGLIDWDGAGGWTLAKRMGKAAHTRVVRLPAYHGSMGSYVPKRYRVPIITWELSRKTINNNIREGLLSALR
jgi:predicted deacylase